MEITYLSSNFNLWWGWTAGVHAGSGCWIPFRVQLNRLKKSKINRFFWIQNLPAKFFTQHIAHPTSDGKRCIRLRHKLHCDAHPFEVTVLKKGKKHHLNFKLRVCTLGSSLEKNPTTPQQSKCMWENIEIYIYKGARYDYIPSFLKHFKNVLFLNRTMKDGQKNYNKSAKNTGQIGDRHQSAWEANTTQWKGKTHTIMHWKDKDLYYNKGFIFKVSKRVFFFLKFRFLDIVFQEKRIQPI